MRKMLSWAAVAAFLAVPGAVCGQQSGGTADAQGQAQATAQSTTVSSGTPQESVAEAARKAREAKKEQPAKAVKVFDNDNIPTTGGVSTAKAEVKEGETGASDQTTGDKKAAPQDEKAWREKFAMLRAKLARDQEDLQVMQRELGVLNLQNYSDPMKGMQQELTRGDINKKTADIDAKQKQIQADQQAIDDAEEQLRKSGGDSGWAR